MRLACTAVLPLLAWTCYAHVASNTEHLEDADIIAQSVDRLHRIFSSRNASSTFSGRAISTKR
jgi:hypothetical protein